MKLVEHLNVLRGEGQLKVFLRQELEEVAAENPDRFKLWYTIDRYPY